MREYHLSHVSKSFGSFRAVDRVDLRIRPGEIHALIGENGAGKSTLLRLFSGELAPDTGGLLIGGREARLAGPAAARRHGIRIVHQELSIVGSLSVAENVMLGHRSRGALFHAPRRQEAAARAALRRLGIDLPPGRAGAALSTAEQQLVEIARATLGRPGLLILDEPTASLATPDADRLLGLMRQLRAEGTAIVFVSHRLDEVLAVADRATVLRRGRITHRFERREMADAGTLIAAMTGGAALRRLPAPAAPPGPELLRLEGLGRAPDFQDVSLSLRAGEITGLAGLVGAGRSALAEAVFGAAPARTGRILRRGRPVAPGSPRAALAEGIVLVPEDRKRAGLVPGLSSAENMTLTRRRAGLPRWRALRREAAEMGQGLVFRGRLGAPVGHCSGGNQQKVLLGRALLSGAEVFLLDEPTRGVDPAARADIYRRIRDLADAGAAVLVISSELQELTGVAARILVMSGGRITGRFDGPDYDETELLEAAFAGHRTAPAAPAQAEGP